MTARRPKPPRFVLHVNSQEGWRAVGTAKTEHEAKEWALEVYAHQTIQARYIDLKPADGLCAVYEVSRLEDLMFGPVKAGSLSEAVALSSVPIEGA